MNRADVGAAASLRFRAMNTDVLVALGPGASNERLGQGALHAGDPLEAMADKLGAPIVKALLGKAAVPDTSPYTTGGIGLLGTRPSQEALETCDTLLIIGSSFPYIEYYPKPGHARSVQCSA